MVDEELVEKIIELRIRPVLQTHGGDIQYKRFEDGVVYVELQGACNGCPGALNTLKNTVEGFLQKLFPEIREVREDKNADGR